MQLAIKTVKNLQVFYMPLMQVKGESLKKTVNTMFNKLENLILLCHDKEIHVKSDNVKLQNVLFNSKLDSSYVDLKVIHQLLQQLENDNSQNDNLQVIHYDNMWTKNYKVKVH